MTEECKLVSIKSYFVKRNKVSVVLLQNAYICYTNCISIYCVLKQNVPALNRLRERERERDRQTDRQTDSERERRQR